MAKIPKRIVKVTFEKYPEIEISAGSISVQEAIDFDQLPFDKMIGRFAEVLRSWNLEDDNGVPIPATAEGMSAIDIGFAREIIAAWSTALTGVSDPLEQPSTDGLPWEAPDFPTEVLSASPAS